MITHGSISCNNYRVTTVYVARLRCWLFGFRRIFEINFYHHWIKAWSINTRCSRSRCNLLFIIQEKEYLRHTRFFSALESLVFCEFLSCVLPKDLIKWSENHPDPFVKFNMCKGSTLPTSFIPKNYHVNKTSFLQELGICNGEDLHFLVLLFHRNF